MRWVLLLVLTLVLITLSSEDSKAQNGGDVRVNFAYAFRIPILE